MAELIADEIYRIDIPLPNNPLKNLNSYFIRGRERSLLIDTGFSTRGCFEAMQAELDLLGADMDKTDIFITHMHADHVGLASQLASGSSKVYMSYVDAAVIKSYDLPRARDNLIASNVSEGFPGEEFIRLLNHGPAVGISKAKPMEYTCLDDGNILYYGGYKLSCILTPGHTPGHMCLYCDDLKMMFLGDHVLFNITPNIVRWPGLENSLGKYLESLRKIGRYDIAVALPAHRSVDSTVEERIMSIIKHHKVRLQEVNGIIRDCPAGLTAYDIAGRMRWDIQSDSWADFPLMQKWFAVGEALAHIDYLLETGDILSEELNGLHLYRPRS